MKSTDSQAGTSAQRLFGFCMAFLFLTPLVYTVFEAYPTTIGAVWSVLTYYAGSFLFTLALATTVTAIACFLAVCALYCLQYIHGRLQTASIWLLAAPLIFPPYIGAISYQYLLKKTFSRLFGGRSEADVFIYGSLVLSVFLFPYVFFLLYSRFRMIDTSHLRILSLYHLSFWDKLKSVYIPELKHAFYSGALVVFLYVCADFGAVSILRLKTATVYLYEDMILRGDFATSSKVSIVFFLFVALITYISKRTIGHHAFTHVEKNARYDRTSAKKTQVFPLLIVATIVVFSVGVPLFQVLSWTHQYIFDQSDLKALWVSSKNPLWMVSLYSISIALLVTVFLVGVAFFYCLIRRIVRKEAYSRIAYLATLIHSLPGIVVAFTVVTVKYSSPLFYPLAGLFFVYAYMVRFSGLAFLTLDDAFQAIPKKYLAIGELFLSSRRDFTRNIIWPYTKQGVFNGASSIFFHVIRDLPIPLLLLPLGVEVLPMRIWQTANEGLYIYAAPAILVLLGLSLPSLIMYSREHL